MSQLINMTVSGEPKPWQVWVRMSAPPPGYLEFKAYQQTTQIIVFTYLCVGIQVRRIEDMRWR